MAAKHKSPVYKSLDIPNPFKEGQDAAYANLLLDKTKEAQSWRKSLFISAAFFAISLILFFVAISQQQIVPVLVNVMPSGEASYLGEVRQSGDIQIPEASILFQVRTFVTYLRSVSTDYQVVFDNIDNCFHMVTQRYHPIMRDMILRDSPFELVGKMRRSIEVESVLLVTGRSYQINWTEIVIESANTKRARYRAIVTIQLIQPTAATIIRNPLGIYIENFEMVEL